MIYTLRHRTTYRYGRSVHFARCTLRLKPQDGEGQSVLASAVTIGGGGSAGSEGPVAVLGSAVGSALGRTFRFDQAPAAYRWLDDHPLDAVKVALAY